MNKRGDMGMIIFILLIVLVMSWMVGSTLYNQTRYDKDCLKEIAIEHCQENDLILSYNAFPQEKTFVCKNSNRELSGTKYKFIKKDLENCKK